MNHDNTAQTINSIARTHFHQLHDRRNPLAAQNNDSADFIEVAVWAIRDALEEAHMCGWADAEAHHKIESAAPAHPADALATAFMATRPDLPPSSLDEWLADHAEKLTAAEKAAGAAILALHEASTSAA